MTQFIKNPMAIATKNTQQPVVVVGLLQGSQSIGKLFDSLVRSLIRVPLALLRVRIGFDVERNQK